MLGVKFLFMSCSLLSVAPFSALQGCTVKKTNTILGQLEEKVPISFTEQDEEAGDFSLKAHSEHPYCRTRHKLSLQY